jgi:hypothetical protein
LRKNGWVSATHLLLCLAAVHDREERAVRAARRGDNVFERACIPYNRNLRRRFASDADYGVGYDRVRCAGGGVAVHCRLLVW